MCMHTCVCVQIFHLSKEEHVENISVMELEKHHMLPAQPWAEGPTIFWDQSLDLGQKCLGPFIFPLKREWFLPALRVNLSTWKTDYSLPPIHPISVWIVSQKGSWSSVISSFTDCFILAINTSSELKTLYLTPQNFDAPLRKLCLEGRPRGPLVSSDAQTHRLTAVHWSSSLEGGLRSM